MSDATLDVPSVAERIRSWALVTPDAPAIEHRGTILSYAALQRRVVHLAAWMHQRGVVPGNIVALNCERSAELVIAMLAAWRIGAAYLPLDPTWPAPRLHSILDQAKPALILRSGACARLRRADEANLQEVDFDPLPITLHAHVTSPHDLAYVLYTSGSTGSPKGVMIEHGQLVNYAAAVSTALDLPAVRRWGLLGSLAADLGYTALFGGLFNGACIVIAEACEVQDSAAFARFMRDKRIEGLKIVPSHLDALLEGDAPALPKRLVLGGEAASAQLVDRVLQLAPHCQIYNHYGPTETTVGVMVHAVENWRDRGSALPLTRVLSNCSVHVLDDERHAVPIGALGQVYVGGAQVCRGYLGDGNADAFLREDRLDSSRLYRTGDLAYRLADGAIRLAGRADDQLKINGFRVEPAEIEAALVTHNEVRQAAVIARSAGDSPVELIAFVVGQQSSGSREANLRQMMAATLPGYMLPNAYVFLESLPRLANGKIDRRQLQAMSLEAWQRTAVATTNDPVEGVILKCMAELLKRESIGSQDDFFELGGHSLLVIKLVARIRRQLGIEIPPATVFDHRTPAALAAMLQRAGAAQAELSA